MSSAKSAQVFFLETLKRLSLQINSNLSNKSKEMLCFCGLKSTLKSAEETTAVLNRVRSCQMCSVSGYTCLTSSRVIELSSPPFVSQNSLTSML